MAETESQTHAPWQREFFKNIEGFVELGVPEEKAKEVLTKFLKLSGSTPMPKVIDSFRDESKLEEVGVFTQFNQDIRDFMMEFFEPLLDEFVVEGKENLEQIIPLLGKYPMTMVANHLSHFDAAAMFCILYREGGDARRLAESMVFIAGRLVFEPDFTRLGLYMINSLLVCSKRDMTNNPAQADLMTRINMRSFRQSQQLQKEGHIITIFPKPHRQAGQLRRHRVSLRGQ